MFFAQHVAFLVRILVRKCKKSKKVKKPFVFPEKNFSNTKMKNEKNETLIFKAKGEKHNGRGEEDTHHAKPSR